MLAEVLQAGVLCSSDFDAPARSMYGEPATSDKWADALKQSRHAAYAAYLRLLVSKCSEVAAELKLDMKAAAASQPPLMEFEK